MGPLEGVVADIAERNIAPSLARLREALGAAKE
jgi:hypothetical protein